MATKKASKPQKAGAITHPAVKKLFGHAGPAHRPFTAEAARARHAEGNTVREEMQAEPDHSDVPSGGAAAMAALAPLGRQENAGTESHGLVAPAAAKATFRARRKAGDTNRH